MADNTAGAPLGATHYGRGMYECVTYYRLDRDMWFYWSNAYEDWRKVNRNIPYLDPIPLEITDMADNTAGAPLGATHIHKGERGVAYYRFDGHVWKFWHVFRNEWERCTDNKPACNPTPLPPSEQSLCCGTTCDKRNVAAYIARLEAIAEAARALPEAAQSESLRAALAEVYHG